MQNYLELISSRGLRVISCLSVPGFGISGAKCSWKTMSDVAMWPDDLKIKRVLIICKVKLRR